MKLRVKYRGETRVLDALTLPVDGRVVGDHEVSALTAAPSRVRAEWARARCAAWRAEHGGER